MEGCIKGYLLFVKSVFTCYGDLLKIVDKYDFSSTGKVLNS